MPDPEEKAEVELPQDVRLVLDQLLRLGRETNQRFDEVERRFKALPDESIKAFDKWSETHGGVLAGCFAVGPEEMLKQSGGRSRSVLVKGALRNREMCHLLEGMSPESLALIAQTVIVPLETMYGPLSVNALSYLLSVLSHSLSSAIDRGQRIAQDVMGKRLAQQIEEGGIKPFGTA